jgi:hypothetical protein
MFYWPSRQGEVQGNPNVNDELEKAVDLTVWDMLQGILSWSARLLFWPLGLVIKYREFFDRLLPHLLLGVIALIVGTAALGLLGGVLRGVAVCARGIHCLFASLLAAFGFPREEKAQAGEEIHVEPTADPSDPYHVLRVSRDVTEGELNARYRQLLRVNHPDKVVQLDPEIQAFATERSRAIIEAYETLRSRAKAS